jgi:hypothetical protein
VELQVAQVSFAQAEVDSKWSGGSFKWLKCTQDGIRRFKMIVMGFRRFKMGPKEALVFLR